MVWTEDKSDVDVKATTVKSGPGLSAERSSSAVSVHVVYTL